MSRRLNGYIAAFRKLAPRRTTDRTPAERVDAWLVAAGIGTSGTPGPRPR
jgi:hypothetical protein